MTGQVLSNMKKKDNIIKNRIICVVKEKIYIMLIHDEICQIY
jgi:hypothetical protein